MLPLSRWIVLIVVHPSRGAMMEFCGRREDCMGKVKPVIENKIVIKKQTGA
jgi:hypothetical protein